MPAPRACYIRDRKATMTPSIELHRAAINRANSQHSTGPRTEAGKQRSSLNAITHGLTAQSPVLPSEDPVAYERYKQALLDEYQPKGPTEQDLVDDLAGTGWRLK